MPEMLQQHTLGHADCPACEEAKRAVMYTEHFRGYLFPQAAQLWLASRRKIGANTRRFYLDYIKSLSTFFGRMPLEQVHIGHLVTYQRSRQAEIRSSKQHAARKRGQPRDDSDGASRINHEIACVLRPVLKHAGLWDAKLKLHYEPLPLPRDSAGMALTPEEEEHWFRVAASKPRWMVAHCCELLSRATTAGPGEIRHLQLKHLDLDNPVGPHIHVEEGVKNDFRIRPLPLNPDARWAVEWLLARYRRLCAQHGVAESPEHCLLPHRATTCGGVPLFERPMGSWKKAHYAIRREAAKKFPRLGQLRRYDFRHTACTDLLEDPSVAYSTVESLMGHRISSKTKRRYDHKRNTALRAAVSALNRGHGDGRHEDREEKKAVAYVPAPPQRATA